MIILMTSISYLYNAIDNLFYIQESVGIAQGKS